VHAVLNTMQDHAAYPNFPLYTLSASHATPPIPLHYRPPYAFDHNLETGVVVSDALGAGGMGELGDMGEPMDANDASDDPSALVTPASPPMREHNVLCCLFACLTGPVLDALCALPGAVLDDVPSSLRTSGLVLTVLLGAPAIRRDAVYVLEQRALLGLLLGSCAFVGLNQAEPTARNADAVFAFVGTLSAVMACSTNGVMQQKDNDDPKSEVVCKSREHLSAFCGALLFYLGMRVLRHSFALSSEILNFKVSHDDINVRGYGVSVDMVVAGNSFAGACTVGFACILLLNHDLIIHVGSAALSNIAGTLACFVFVGAFVAQMASFTSMEQLPALFSASACDGDEGECAAAYRARRLFSASNSTSVSWVCAVALTVYSFSHAKRFKTRREHFEYEADIYSLGSIAAISSAAVCCLAVFLFADPSRSMDWSDLELVLLLISIPVCLLGWPAVGCFVHAAGQAVYVWTRVELYGGYDWAYFTHHSLLATFTLAVSSGCLSLFSYGLYSFDRRRLYSEPVEVANAVLLTALVSTQTFLTLGTLGMTAGYSGVYYSDGKGSWRISGYEFTVQHCVSFFFVACLYGTRYEHETLPVTFRRASWFALPPLLGLTWLVCISAEASGGSPYHHYVDSASFLIGVSSAAASWTGVGVYLHV